MLGYLVALEDTVLQEELEEAVPQAEVLEVVTQEELQAEGILVEEVPDFLEVMELGMVPKATLAKIQVTTTTTELGEMMTVEMTQVAMDTIFLSGVQVVPNGPLWMRDSENQE